MADEAAVAPPSAEHSASPSFNRLLGQVERQVSRQLDTVLAPEGLTVDQWRVLDLLSHGEGYPMAEIAAAIAVPGPSLTKIVDRLVNQAAVYRLVDERDRRRVLAFISEHGRELHEHLAPQVRTIDRETLQRLGDDGQLLLTLLTRLAEA